MRTLLMISCLMMALFVAVQAQAPSQQAPPPGQQTQPPRPAPTPPPGIQPPSQQANVWQNIKLDITITDAASATTRKVLSLYIADGRQGQVRSQSEQGLINIDARPSVRPDSKTIMLQISVEYRLGSSSSLFTESLTAMVPDGKPMVLSQTADPSGERKVSVEVVATIQKN